MKNESETRAQEMYSATVNALDKLRDRMDTETQFSEEITESTEHVTIKITFNNNSNE